MDVSWKPPFEHIRTERRDGERIVVRWSPVFPETEENRYLLQHYTDVDINLRERTYWATIQTWEKGLPFMNVTLCGVLYEHEGALCARPKFKDCPLLNDPSTDYGALQKEHRRSLESMSIRVSKSCF